MYCQFALVRFDAANRAHDFGIRINRKITCAFATKLVITRNVNNNEPKVWPKCSQVRRNIFKNSMRPYIIGERQPINKRCCETN